MYIRIVIILGELVFGMGMKEFFGFIGNILYFKWDSVCTYVCIYKIILICIIKIWVFIFYNF